MFYFVNKIGRILKVYNVMPPRLTFWFFRQAYRVFPWFGCKGDEWRFVLSRLPPLMERGIRVADIGGGLSLLPFELAARGYEVTVYDQIEFKRRIKNFRYVRTDVRNIQETDFDVVLCISVIEHIGVGAYGDEVFTDGDTVALGKMAQVLKPGGLLFLTTPHMNYTILSDRKYTFTEIIDKVQKSGLRVVYSDVKSHQILLIAEKPCGQSSPKAALRP